MVMRGSFQQTLETVFINTVGKKKNPKLCGHLCGGRVSDIPSSQKFYYSHAVWL